jgi:hypothetical protein
MTLISTLLSKVSCIKQNTFCNSDVVIYKMYNSSIPVISPKVTVQFKVISSEADLNKFTEFSEIKSLFWKFRDFLNKGSQLYLAFVADNLAGYYLVTDLTRHKPYLFNYHSIFGVGSNYFIFYCRTFERYRNNAIYSYALTYICKNLAPHDGSVFISADSDNVFSQKGIEKAGFKKIGSLRYIQLFKFVMHSKFLGADFTDISQNNCEDL